MILKITVQVKTNSKHESVEKNKENSYTVRVNTPPVDGKANKRVIELLAKYLNQPKSSIQIVSGFKSKIKIIQIPDS